ncbi:hypothetical protein [Piscinibacter sp.]|uniref:hypothetical protein n=1 Tax=Piscinibacter sp. TaxID=1903157 RepID=UPI0039E59126
MRALRFLGFVAAGFLLYFVVVVYLGGYLAAIHVPPEYFAFFGRERGALAVALLSFTSYALPIAAVSAVAVAALARLQGGSPRSAFAGAFVGMVLAWVALHVLFFPYSGSSGSLLHSLWVAVSGSWWGLPNLLAPWVGLSLAFWYCYRKQAVRTPAEA